MDMTLKNIRDIQHHQLPYIQSPFFAAHVIERVFLKPFDDSLKGVKEILSNDLYHHALKSTARSPRTLKLLLAKIERAEVVLVYSLRKPFGPAFRVKPSSNVIPTARGPMPEYETTVSPPGAAHLRLTHLAAGLYSRQRMLSLGAAGQNGQSNADNKESVAANNDTFEQDAAQDNTPQQTPLWEQTKYQQQTKRQPQKPPIAAPNLQEEQPKPDEPNWLKIQAYYEDKWRTALPLQGLTVKANQALHQSNLALNAEGNKSTAASTVEQAQQTANEAGVLVLQDLPDGPVEIEVERQEGLEKEIQNLRDSLTQQLDGAYRDTVSSMSGFQTQWDDYGYASIAMSGGAGVWEGTKGWVNDQADLFEAKTWSNLADLISDYAGKAYDGVADYAAETYERIEKTVNDTSEALADNADNLTNWHWYVQSAEQAIEDAQANSQQALTQAQDYLDDAADYLSSTAKDIDKLYKHRQAIMNLPTLISQGDAMAVQDFIDNVLMDIDPEMATSIKDSSDFHIVLELIDDHQAALIYTAYLSLFIDAIPPNFYAYVSGKGGVYLVIEIILLVLLSFLTLGAGAAARITTLTAKLAASGAKAAVASKKIKQAQQAVNAVKRTVEDFANSADTLKQIGKKLTVARSVGIKKKASSNSTLAVTKKNQKRDTRCRRCKKTDHSTPRASRNKGNIHYV